MRNDVQGYLAMEDSELVSMTAWPLLSISTSALVILEELLKQRWLPGRCSQPHRLQDQDKVSSIMDYARHKCYLQCVLDLRALCEKGLRELPIQEHMYYQCLLQLPVDKSSM